MPKMPSSRIRRAKPCPCTTTSTIRPSWLEKLNGLIEDTEFAKSPLAEIVIKAPGGTFNNGAQAWNHAFFWQCLRPDGDPQRGLASAIARDFGNVEALREEFSNGLTTLFGFGWTWLAMDGDGGLGIETHGNAGNPLTDGRLPLLTCDRWEHDYYVDYRNEKKRYVDAFWHLINWNVAAQNMLQRKGPFNLKAAVGRCPRCARDVHRVP